MEKIKGKLVGKDLKIGVVVSRFNDLVTSKLLDGAIDTLIRHGVDEKDVEIYWTPGSFEIPLIAKKLAIKDYNAIVALGAVIRGSTPHFEYVSSEVAKGIAQVSLDTGIPIAFGVITADSLDQALERAGSKSNKGVDAARTAIEMANLIKSI